MTLSVRRGYRKKQPILHSFVSGVAYRIIVKLYFRRKSTFYLVVSICENTSFRRFLSFLTAGNKSKCGTLQRLTHSRQSTDSPILKPVSSSKRQASQRKPFALSSVSAQTSSHLRIHGTSVPSRPQKFPGTLIRTKSAPNLHPRRPPATPIAIPKTHPSPEPAIPPQSHPSLPKSACNSQTGVTQRHEVIRTGNMSRGNCMRNCRAPHCAPRKVARNSPRTSFTNSSKTAEYQRSHFKTRNILKGITCEIARQRPV